MTYFAYILKSESHFNHYYGHTYDLENRLKQHNSDKVRYTKGRKPWKIHYYEEFQTRSDARRREIFFKSIEGYKYLKENGII